MREAFEVVLFIGVTSGTFDLNLIVEGTDFSGVKGEIDDVKTTADCDFFFFDGFTFTVELEGDILIGFALDGDFDSFFSSDKAVIGVIESDNCNFIACDRIDFNRI